MRLVFITVGSLILASLLLSKVDSADRRFEPATFMGGPAKFAEKIKFPRFLNSFPQRVYCRVHINRKGLVTGSQCLGKQGTNPTLGTGIERILDGYRFNPASVDGVSKRVRMYFTVYYLRDEKGDDIVVAPNLGLNREAYGFNYIAPQLYALGNRHTHGCSQFHHTYISLTIDADGLVKEYDHLPTRTNQACLDQIEDGYLTGRYIPAIHDGQAVPANHYEMYILEN